MKIHKNLIMEGLDYLLDLVDVPYRFRELRSNMYGAEWQGRRKAGMMELVEGGTHIANQIGRDLYDIQQEFDKYGFFERRAFQKAYEDQMRINREYRQQQAKQSEPANCN